MGLKVYTGKNNFSKPDEGAFFYQFAFATKKLFAENDYDGILMGVPFVKDRSERYLQTDAVIFAKNAIIIVDYKSIGGKIKTPPFGKPYHSQPWRTNTNKFDNIVKGGSYANPFEQVQHYKTLLLQDILHDVVDLSGKYINTGVIFYGDNIDVSDAHVPEEMKSNFFIATDTDTPDNYYFHIKSILSSRPRERSIILTDEDLHRIRMKYNVNEELLDKEIEDLLVKNGSKEETRALELRIQQLQESNKAKDVEIAINEIRIEDRNKTISKTSFDLKNERINSNLLAKKNLELIEDKKKAKEKAIEAEEARVYERKARLKAEEKQTDAEAKQRTAEEKQRMAEEKMREIAEIRRKEKASFNKRIEELKANHDVPEELVQKLNDLSIDVKSLKINNFNNSSIDNEKWDKSIRTLEKRFELLEEKIAENNTAIATAKQPKWLWLLFAGSILLLFGIVFAIILNMPAVDTESVISIPRPEKLDGPFEDIYVYDGDTIGFYDNGVQRKVRLIGIEAPEVESSYSEEECFGKQATSYLWERVKGNKIYLEYDDSQGNVDYYGRLVRYVWIDDTMLNLDMILGGYAKESTFRNSYKYKAEFDLAQSRAKEKGLNAWTTCAQQQ